MATVSDLIHSSFRLIGAIAAGETLETNELNDAFVSLNQMIAIWNNDGTLLVGRQHQTVAVTAGAYPAYSLPQRPISIEAASVWQQGADSALEIVDAAGWEAIPEKQMQSMFCKKLYCDYNYPSATIYIWPVPRFNGTLEVWILSWIPQFATVNDAIDLPPGYEMALRYNFAVALLPEYPRSAADPSLPAQAQMYKQAIAQLNAQHHYRSQQQAPTQAAISSAAETAAR